MEHFSNENYTCKILVLGKFKVNCILLKNNKTNEIIIFDPGSYHEKIIQAVAQMGGIPKLILLTHAHFDHIGAVDKLKQEYNIKCYGPKDELEFFKDGSKNLSLIMGFEITLTPDKLLVDEEILNVCGFKIKCVSTPGHTPGGMSFLIDDLAIVGDTLFKGMIGRSDLPGGNQNQLIDSIKKKLLTLPPKTKILPGHDEITTVDYESLTNPFIINKR